MSRVIQLSGLKQGIQRVREKGGADPDTLYDLVNGYVTIDGGVNQRPGTVEDAELPAGTLGLMAWNNQLVVFSTTVKSGMPDGYRCEVIVHPFFPSTGLSYIWFARPMMGYPYVVAEFANGDVFHYWLESANSWEASTMYLEGQVIVPSTPNGLAYKAHRTLPKMPTWTAGMEVFVGTKVEPTEENGYYYEATATNEASGVGTPGGSPNPGGGDTDPPGDGGSGTGGSGGTPGTTPPGSITPIGAAASGGLGTNGGFADDADPALDLPSVFGSDIVGTAGDFADQSALNQWTGSNGGVLIGWTIDGGRAKYYGLQNQYSYAYLRPVQLRMSHMPFPRYSVTITADVQTLAGTNASIGFEQGGSAPAEYLSSTHVSYTFVYSRERPGITGVGAYVVPTMLPKLSVTGDGVLSAWFDNVEVEITEISPACTTETIINGDLASGMTGISAWPADNPAYFDMSVSGGELSHRFLSTVAPTRVVWWDDPLTLADAVGKYIHHQGEVLCTDPTVASGITTGGAAFGIVVVDVATGEPVSPLSMFGLPERGDWTAREAWVRQHIDNPAYTIHKGVLLRAAPGYVVKIRNSTVETTDSVIDP